MQQVPGRDTRTIRLALTGVALLLLLAVVAFASRSGFGHASSSRPAPGYVSWAMSVFVVLFVLLIPVAVWAFVTQQRYEERKARSFQARVARSLAILFLIMLLAVAAAWLRRTGRLPDVSNLLSGGSSGHAGQRGHRSTPYSPTFQWPVLWATLAPLALMAGALWWSWRRQRELLAQAPPAAPTVADELTTSIDDAIDDLEAEPDARLAVIAAYARMERALSRSGIGRAPSETALEYLRRVLVELSSRADAAGRLTALFERAKFSRHAVDATMKREAIAALREIRDGLQAVPAGR